MDLALFTVLFLLTVPMIIIPPQDREIIAKWAKDHACDVTDIEILPMPWSFSTYGFFSQSHRFVKVTAVSGDGAKTCHVIRMGNFFYGTRIKSYKIIK